VSAAEWATAGVGLALVVAVVALLAREAVGSAHRPPDVTVTADSVVRGRGGWLVLYTARNAGDATAAALTLRATHAAGADTVERDAQVDYLPARSERKGGFIFPRDPRAGTLRLEAVGYEEP
jgi:uncharacterized protein (TIGR02588 family)